MRSLSHSPDLSVPVLAPHPRWRWGSYPPRWLVGGVWSLGRWPLGGLFYGAVFAAGALAWTLAIGSPTLRGLVLALGVTLVILLGAPRLTAALLCGMGGASEAPDRREPHGAFLALGALLALMLFLGLLAARLCFSLLYTGAPPSAAPSLPVLAASVMSWRNAPLLLAAGAILSVTLLWIQLIGAVATFALRELGTDLTGALRVSAQVVRANWRPLLWWALFCQAAVLGLGAVWPLALVPVAPVLAHGTWWAFRESALGR